MGMMVNRLAMTADGPNMLTVDTGGFNQVVGCLGKKLPHEAVQLTVLHQIDRIGETHGSESFPQGCRIRLIPDRHDDGPVAILLTIEPDQGGVDAVQAGS